MALQFEKCCCCCQLRTGCLVIGYLGLIFSILAIVATAMGMVGYQVDDKYVKLSPAVGTIAIIIYGVEVIFSALLLAGVYKSKPSLVNAAWIYMFVGAILSTIAQLSDSKNHNAASAVGLVLGLAIGIYFALCVRSYYLQLKGEGFRPTAKA